LELAGFFSVANLVWLGRRADSLKLIAGCLKLTGKDLRALALLLGCELSLSRELLSRRSQLTGAGARALGFLFGDCCPVCGFLCSPQQCRRTPSQFLVFVTSTGKLAAELVGSPPFIVGSASHLGCAFVGLGQP
jgi:hypothetical protein